MYHNATEIYIQNGINDINYGWDGQMNAVAIGMTNLKYSEGWIAGATVFLRALSQDEIMKHFKESSGYGIGNP